MPESRDKEDLIGKMLLKAGLVDQEQLENVRKIQSTLQDRGASVSSLSILHQNELVSRADLEKLQEFVDDRFQQIGSILPPGLQHSFLKDESLARRALESGVVSREQFDRANEARKLLADYGMEKSTTELLVEQESIDVQKLQGLRAADSAEDTMADPGADTASFETIDTESADTGGGSTDSTSYDTSFSSQNDGAVMTSVDRNLLEELVRQDRIERSQIPDIVNRARRKQEQDDPSSSPVRSVLKEMELMTPENAGDLIDAAMQNQARRERWDTRSLLRIGAMLASVLLLIALTGFLFSSLTGTDTDGEDTGTTAAASNQKTQPEESTNERSSSSSSPPSDPSNTSDASSESSTASARPSPLLTFTKQFNVFRPDFASCTCSIAYDGRQITKRKTRISADGRLRLTFGRSANRDAFSEGLYLARCSVGGTTPRMPQDPLNALEMYGPKNQEFQNYIYEEQWYFRMLSSVGSLSSILNNRFGFAEKLRTAVQRILDDWSSFRNAVDQSAPNFKRIEKRYSTLKNHVSGTRKILVEIDRTYRTHPYPDQRARLKDVTQMLPRIARGLVKTLMEREGRQIPDNLQKRAGATTNNPEKQAATFVKQLKAIQSSLPENKDAVQISSNLRKLFKKDLLILLQNETFLRLLGRDNVLQEGLPDSDQVMMRSTLTQIYRYVSTHVEFHALLVENAGALRLLPDQKAEQVRQLPDLLNRHLNAVLIRLAERVDVDLPFKLKSVDRPIRELRTKIDRIAEMAGVSYKPFSDGENQPQ